MNIHKENRSFGRDVTNILTNVNVNVHNIEHAMNKVNLNDHQPRASLAISGPRKDLDIRLDPIEEEHERNPQLVEDYAREISQYTVKREQ